MDAPTVPQLAAALRDACARAAIDAYEEAGVQGLCAEGRFEAAIGAIERVTLPAAAPHAAAAAPAAGPHRLADTIVAAGTMLEIRSACRDDLAAIVVLLADDALGAQRERVGAASTEGTLDGYAGAFAAIEADPHCELLVVCRAARVIGTMQLNHTPGLSRHGAWRATIEAVRVARDERSRGVGRAMIEYAIGRARVRGCRIVQLASDRSRVDAHRFYERLGFVASHVGMKLELAGVPG
jgi:GNAT superfamily N-acetyltransferase